MLDLIKTCIVDDEIVTISDDWHSQAEKALSLLWELDKAIHDAT